MMRVTPLVWMSFGLVSLTLSVMMAGNSLVALLATSGSHVPPSKGSDQKTSARDAFRIP